MRNKILPAIGLALVMLLVCAASGAAQTSSSIHLEPGTVSIGAMYNGAQVTITGTIPASAQVLVEVKGERNNVVLSKKGKAFGLLWMNTGEVSLENAPKVYMLNLPEAYSAEEDGGDDALTSLGVGFEKLAGEVSIESSDGDANDKALFEEFVKLKKKEGLYALNNNAVKYTGEKKGVRSFSCNIFLPPRMKQGDYVVTAVVIKDGKVVERDDRPLEIKRVGIPEFMAKVAYEHGALYGIIASVIAIMAGLGMGLIFGGDGGSH
ncbi:TIGR02186 family protein [Desulfatibacillum aliphaticivorans]|uniref:TIGR02186 family protein n=1 Tax=Desulfatibacillum aliphaticivorans TaxID=218208 RepID=UPI00040849A7|nr:TIGR02186 family protein [Desulfatibacillum aliphaticivorans]